MNCQTPEAKAAELPGTNAAPRRAKKKPSSSNAEGPSVFVDVEPCADPVDGEQLFNEMFATIRKYIVADDATVRAAVLWAVHTWLMDVWEVSPIASITAMEMRCGKTVFLRVLAELVYRPLQTSNCSDAVLFRVVDEWSPTLLIDEVDTFLKGNGHARGILNTGLYRKGAYVTRCSGKNHTVRQFSVWGAKALCGIGDLPPTLADRSIQLWLRRKLPDEHVENLHRSDPEQWSSLRSRIARWRDDHHHDLFRVKPPPVAELNDRSNDCWEPLLAIAEAAGSAWREYARRVAIDLEDRGDVLPHTTIRLLQDVRDILKVPSDKKMFSSDLLYRIIAWDRDEYWKKFNDGKPLTAHQLAQSLRQVGVRAKPIRIGSSSGKNGYELSWFSDAFARYLPTSTEPNVGD